MNNNIPYVYRKSPKIFYYLDGFFNLLLSNKRKSAWLEENYNNILLRSDIEQILDRVNYYNQIVLKFKRTQDFVSIKDFKKIHKNNYFFDLYKYLRYFLDSNYLKLKFGDVIDRFDMPTIVKSRPIENSSNSVIMNLDSRRHFYFTEDKINFKDKKNILMWRGAVYQKHRKKFIQKFYKHKLCDVGDTGNSQESILYKKNYMTIKDQLGYKFIFSIEGNDVATSLKWSMYSNSLVFMVKPKYETWFMEGKLIPGYHYVLIEDDYSNLEEKIVYFSNPNNYEEALGIIKNANNYVEQFFDIDREKIISLLVLKKYFAKLNLKPSQD